MDHYVHVFYMNALYEDISELEKLKERFSSSKRYPVEHAKAIEKTKAYIEDYIEEGEMYEALNKYITVGDPSSAPQRSDIGASAPQRSDN